MNSNHPDNNHGVSSATAESDAPPKPDITALARTLRGRRDIPTLCLLILCILAVFYTLYFARTFFLPIVLASLLSALLKPAVRKLARLRIPTPLGALIVLVVLGTFLGYGIMRLTDPATKWIQMAPETLRGVESKIREMLVPARKLHDAAKKIEAAAGGTDEAPTQVELKKTSLTDLALSYSQSFAFGLVETLIVLYFFLAAGDHFMRKLIHVLPRLREKKEAVELTREIEGQVSRYLLTITAINVAEGVIVAGVMALLGMPNPVLWGVAAFAFNFVPYLGALCNFAVLLIVGLVTFDKLGPALLPALCYCAINVVEGNVLTPMILGQRFTLNPGVVFISIMFWGFMWGVPGMLLAFPVLMTFKIICDHIAPLAPVSAFLTE